VGLFTKRRQVMTWRRFCFQEFRFGLVRRMIALASALKPNKGYPRTRTIY